MKSDEQDFIREIQRTKKPDIRRKMYKGLFRAINKIQRMYYLTKNERVIEKQNEEFYWSKY